MPRVMNQNAISWSIRSAALTLFALLAAFAADARAITVATVPVDNVGNGNDPLTGNLYGRVSYAYRIGTTEVTNAQYAEFLNAKAKSDPLALYNTSMGSEVSGGIARSGSSPNFSYAPKTNMDNKPVIYVSWYDSIRFANWLNNGQGSNSTETGAYTILGNTATPSNGLSITRNVGATWFLPSHNEWYKAAYYQPAAQGGDADNYWLYPTKSNVVPTHATANSVGDINNPGTNVANYHPGAVWNGQADNFTTVGGAGLLAQSFYGTSDQGGNAYEWIELRGGLRGGSAQTVETDMRSTYYAGFDPSFGDVNRIGFRVASVPMSGDFNNNGTVDAADYIVWRNSNGTPTEYNTWRAHFGTVSPGIGAGSGASSALPLPPSHFDNAVPEPTSLALLLLATASFLIIPRDRVAAKNRC